VYIRVEQSTFSNLTEMVIQNHKVGIQSHKVANQLKALDSSQPQCNAKLEEAWDHTEPDPSGWRQQRYEIPADSGMR